MADIFISYAREDRTVAQRLAQLLTRRGWSVWWDRDIVPGNAFAEVIATEIDAAGCVIVLWSRASVGSRWVRDEAQAGLDRKVLVPVLIESVAPPLGFRSIHAADLSAWDGRPEHPDLSEFVDELAPLIAARQSQGASGGLADVALRSFGPPRAATGSHRHRFGLRLAIGVATAAILLSFAAVAWLGHGWLARSEPPRVKLWDMPPGVAAFASIQDCDGCPELVAVPPGSFQLGASRLERDAQSDERPLVNVDIGKPFALGRHEVTFAEWEACASDGGCSRYPPDDEGWGRGDHPVIFVSWDQAQAFVAWLRDKTGKAYRLPSEAEWEYACRAGANSPYAFGDALSPEQAAFNRNTGGTRPVARYPKNSWGLYDMHGNVWEWVEDVWRNDHRDHPGSFAAVTTGPDADDRVVKGGSWDDPPRRLRCSSRNKKDRDQRENEIGFRVARDL